MLFSPQQLDAENKNPWMCLLMTKHVINIIKAKRKKNNLNMNTLHLHNWFKKCTNKTDREMPQTTKWNQRHKQNYVNDSVNADDDGTVGVSVHAKAH